MPDALDTNTAALAAKLTAMGNNSAAIGTLRSQLVTKINTAGSGVNGFTPLEASASYPAISAGLSLLLSSLNAAAQAALTNAVNQAVTQTEASVRANCADQLAPLVNTATTLADQLAAYVGQ